MLYTKSLHSGPLLLSLLTMWYCLGASSLAGGDDIPKGHGDTVEKELLQSLCLEAATLFTPRLPTIPATEFCLEVPLNGRRCTLILHPYSVRAPGYTVYGSHSDGTLHPLPSGPVNTWRGSVVEFPGSTVTAALGEQGAIASIRIDEHERWWVEPVPEQFRRVAAGDHLIFRQADVMGCGGTCGVTAAMLSPDLPYRSPPIAHLDFGYSIAELAFDVDWLYYDTYGSATEDQVNALVALVNDNYLEVGIEHQISTMIIRTSPGDDPYTTTDPGSLLGQFREYWNEHYPWIERDTAHLMTGRSLDGNVIGIAWVDAICSSTYGYGLSEDLGNMVCDTDLISHELGHNWGADHCSCSNTMNSGLTCTNDFHNIETAIDMRAYRDDAACLDLVMGPCYAAGNNPQSDIGFIFRVGMDEEANTSGPSNHSDFTDIPFIVHRGETYTVILTRGGVGEGDAIAGLWIDWTGDEDFFDFFETISLAEWENTSFIAEVTVPSPTPIGMHLMRLRIQDMNEEPTVIPCGETLSGEVEDYFLDVRESLPPPPETPINDSCIDALPITDGTYLFDTTGATTDGPDEELGCSENGDTSVQADIWYRYTAECTGLCTVQTCASNFNTKIAAYENGCPSSPWFDLLSCNDDACGLQSIILFPVLSGEEYWLRIGGYQGDQGNGLLTVTCQPQDPACPEDLDSNGIVGFGDVLAILTEWGPCNEPCPGDLDSNGTVGFEDILIVLSAWGPC